MASKKLTEAQIKKQKAADAVTYKVMIALVLLFISILSLIKLNDYCQTVGGGDLLGIIDQFWWIGAVFAGICAVLLIVLKHPAARLLLPWGVAVGVIAALAGKSIARDSFPLLCVLCAALIILYIIFQLYRWEFFLFSAATFAAGVGFYRFSRSLSFDLSSFAVLGILIIVCALCFGCVFLGAKNKGRLAIGSISYKMFSPKFNPLPVYLAAAFWVVCAVAVFFLGNMFSYYCMFAAIAVEFIAAVYYTIQLR